MKIAVVIVTYADRSGFVKQVVERILSFNIHSIVIVNNNSTFESSEVLESLSSGNQHISLINLDRNTGSAYAFNRGIEYALTDCGAEYIWLLDDDNLPDADAHAVLVKNMNDELKQCSRDKIIISLLRDGRINYLRAIECAQPWHIIGRSNIFRSFHIASLSEHIVEPDRNIFKGEISAVPYGGMFFHGDVIRKTGYPDENYFVYCDDFDFCCRHISGGGKIFLSIESGISDIEKSWNASGRAVKSIACGEFIPKSYYSVRNRVYLEKKYLVTSWPVYLINMTIYSSLVTLLALSRLKFKNIITYYTAVYHGLTGRMGYNGKYSM